MVGQILQVQRPFSIAGTLWLVVAIFCLLLAVAAREVGWAIFAILPLCLGIACWACRERDFHAVLSEAGIWLHPAGDTIPYAEMIRVVPAKDRSRAGALTIVHRNGRLRIPACWGVSSDHLLVFLQQRIPASGIPSVSPKLQNYLNSHGKMFGFDRVWAHNAYLDTASSGRLNNLIFGAATIAMSIWFLAGIGTQRFEWVGLAIFVWFMFLLGWVIVQNRRVSHYGIKKWQESSLVVSPAGIALTQGDLTGELRWAELRSVKFKDSSAPRNRRIELRVEGAQILVKDIYDTPLKEVHAQIEHYWQAG